MNRKYVSRNEAALKLGMSYQEIYNLVRKGKLEEHVISHRNRLVNPDDYLTEQNLPLDYDARIVEDWLKVI